MMLRARKPLALPALLALLLIGAWVCIGVFHEHSGSPTCQICNALQFTAADVVSPAGLKAPAEVARALAPATLPAAISSEVSTPQGRAPPTA